MIHPLVSRLAVAALVVGLTSTARAEDYAKDHLAAAKQAIEVSHVGDGLDNILIAVAQQTKTLLARTNPALSSTIDEITNAAALELAAKRPELDKQIQEIWAARFSKAELEEISRFYASPVGQKLSKETGGMVQMSGVAAQVWQQKIGQEMLAKVREEMKKRGHAL
ncbi:MAG: DUF2059 domain-containing protein [Siculibacillus sp.]